MMRHNSIRTRTAIVLLVISLLIMLVFGGLWIYSTYKSTKDNITRSNFHDAQIISQYVNEFINNIAIAETAEAVNRNTVEAIGQNKTEYLRGAGDSLDRVISNSDVVVILDHDGNVLYHSRGANTTQFVASGGLDGAYKTNETFVTGLYLSRTLKRYVFAVAVPVKDDDKVIGYIVTAVDPVRLNEEIQKWQLDQDRSIIVVDSQGLVVSHNIQTYVDARANLSDTLPVQSARNGAEGVVETSETFDRQLRIAGFSPVPISSWGVIVSTPMTVVYSQVFQKVSVIIVLLVGGSLVIITISYFLSRYLTDPIVELSNTMRSISAGKYKVRAKSARNDEIGDLSRTFNSMMNDLERTVELEHAVEMSKKYQLIFQRAKDPLFSIDIEGKILDANKAACQVYGYTQDELLSRSLSDLTAPEELFKLPKIIEKCITESCVYETVHVKKDGSAFSVEFRAAGTSLGDKQVIIASVRDITDRKQAEKAVITARDQAEKEKNHAIEETQIYLDIMGHDINNLNQTSLMNLEMIKDDPGLTDQEKKAIKAAFQATQSSSEIIDNVRKLQQIMTGKLELHPIDLDEMILDCIKQAPNPADKSVNINYTQKPGMIVMSLPLIKEVFCNLINNSIKYSGGEVTIDIRTGEMFTDGKKSYQITVEDNGFGIPDEVKPRLFHRFQRGTTKAPGKGLGLYIVKSLLEKFEGSIKVENRVPGDYTKGSKFIVSIPAADAEKNTHGH